MPLVLTVEDDVDLAQLNARLLKRQGFDVLVANSAAQARQLFKANKPDLLILDIQLPDGDGLKLCNEFQKATDAPVLFLTGRTETEDRIKGLKTGGDYYLTKPYDKSEFLAVVKSLLRRAEQTREKIAESSVITMGSITLKLNERKAFVDGFDVGLSPKEFAILIILMENEGNEVTYEQLYKAVWETPMNNDQTALRKQISRLKRKIGEEESRDFAIFNEHGSGYTFCKT